MPQILINFLIWNMRLQNNMYIYFIRDCKIILNGKTKTDVNRVT